MVSEILLMPDIKTDIKLTKSQENFLLSLLKEGNETLFKDLVKNLKISKEELLKITQNDPKLQEKVLKILDRPKIKPKTETTEKVQSKPKEEKELTDFLQHFITQEKNTQTQTKTDIKITKKDEKKVVEIIKKEIISKTDLKNRMETKKEITEFKKIDSLKELIAFANKKGLNIEKIKISKPTKEEIRKIINENQIIKTEEIIKPKPKISIKTPKKPTNIISKNNIKTEKTTLKSLLSEKTPQKHPLHTKRQTDENIDLTTLINKKDSDFKIQEPDIPKTTQTKESIKNKEKAEQNILIQNTTHLKHTILKAKESIKHFAKNLQEAVENYKPPISKVSLELNPKELGKVEITLIHRGDNLQIQVNGQNQTISFFNQYQTDLKNALVNMGYSDVNMSFNQNSQNQQKNQEKYKQAQQNISIDEDEFIIEIPYQYA